MRSRTSKPVSLAISVLRWRDVQSVRNFLMFLVQFKSKPEMKSRHVSARFLCFAPIKITLREMRISGFGIMYRWSCPWENLTWIILWRCYCHWESCNSSLDVFILTKEQMAPIGFWYWTKDIVVMLHLSEWWWFEFLSRTLDQRRGGCLFKRIDHADIQDSVFKYRHVAKYIERNMLREEKIKNGRFRMRLIT